YAGRPSEQEIEAAPARPPPSGPRRAPKIWQRTHTAASPCGGGDPLPSAVASRPRSGTLPRVSAEEAPLPPAAHRPNGASGRPEVVCGVGASAGGLAALRAFVRSLSRGAGVSVVVAQHASPEQPPLLAGLLARETELDVVLAEEALELH